MNDYRPNSHKYKEEQKEATTPPKKIEKVVVNGARTRKNDVRKLTDVFVSEDAKNVKQYIFMDVLVPTIKKAIVDIVSDGVNMIFFGGTSRGKSSSMDKISYKKYYDKKDGYRPSENSRARFDYDDVVFDTRGEAEAALTQMDELIARYGAVTVGDLYDMAAISAPYTANRYGWMDVRNAQVVRLIGGGYVIKLPKAMPID